ncbi:MAG: methyltransferase domain-containing protein [Flavobacteriales bacterium]|nr:methyltransferase domain-containing protein [Flavobacteriales bacterium]
MYKKIEKCMICGNDNLVPILHLGDQALTGVFPKSKEEAVGVGPLELVKCHSDEDSGSVCNLVQLHHSFDGSEMYGLNYGYRSGLNKSMVRHLQDIVAYVQTKVDLEERDLIIDIGSNDSTLLQSYPSDKNLRLTGIDPTGVKFKEYYPSHIKLIPEFFSADAVRGAYGDDKAKVVTSIAMIYDLEDPLSFVQQVHDVMADDGIWVFEQSYLPAMIEANAYDTICHEHLEYYGMAQIQWMVEQAGLKIINVELNDTNGGSFLLTVAKKDSIHEVSPTVQGVVEMENALNLNDLAPYEDFAKGVYAHKAELQELLKKLKENGESVFGYGASTKGNVVLQYCGLTNEDIPYIAEVNEDKFGSFTPGTHIPIISEKEARAMNPDHFFVLPWHFRKGILDRERDYMESGGKFIFPLPKIEIVGQ